MLTLNFAAAGSDRKPTMPQGAPDMPEEGKNNWWIWVIVAVLVIVLLLLRFVSH